MKNTDYFLILVFSYFFVVGLTLNLLVHIGVNGLLLLVLLTFMYILGTKVNEMMGK